MQARQAGLMIPPVLVLTTGLTLQWVRQLPWDDLVRLVAVAALTLWLAALAVTVWCVCAPGGRRRPVTSEPGTAPPATT